MESLPAANSEVAAIRAKFVRAGAGEVRFGRTYVAVLQAGAEHKPLKSLAQRSDAQKAAFLKLNAEGGKAFDAAIERLGGLAAFHGRINSKPLEELLATMRQQVGK
jgi:hypothetical protein